MREALERMGLTPGESEVYEALVELGPCTTGVIVKKASLASSKVYEVLTRLTAKGLANHVIKNGVKHYDATPPERLIDFIEEKRSELEQVKQEVRSLLPSLAEKRREANGQSGVVVYQGLRGPAIVLKEAIEAAKKGSELLGYGTDDDPYTTHLPAQLQEHFREQQEHNIRWKLLFNHRFKSPNPLAEIRCLPPGFVVPVRTMIYGDNVAIVDFSKPVTTIVITKREIAQSYRKQFRYLWRIAKTTAQP